MPRFEVTLIVEADSEQEVERRVALTEIALDWSIRRVDDYVIQPDDVRTSLGIEE